MSRHLKTTKLILCLLLGLLVCNGCLCSKEKTDEEILKERIDTSSVKMYLTIKVAILRSSDSPEVAEAREQLMKLLGSVSSAHKADRADSGLSLGDLAQAGTSLWALRSLGAELLEGNKDDELDPILPKLLDPDKLTPELTEMLNANTEHMLLLTTFFVLKGHPRSPVPIPAPVLLYEAYKTDPDTLKLPGAAPVAHALKAYIYGMEELCDLSSKHSAALSKTGPKDSAELLGTGAKGLGLTAPDLSPDDQKRFHAWLRVVGHGSACLCHRKRGDDDKFLQELEHLIEAAGDAGASDEDLAYLRAYLAYRQEKFDQVKVQLDILIKSEKTSETERKHLQEIAAYFEKREDGSLAKYYDKAFFAKFIYKIGKQEVERTGIIAQAEASPVGQTLNTFSTGLGQLLDQTSGLVPTTDKVKETGKGLLNKVFGDDEAE